MGKSTTAIFTSRDVVNFLSQIFARFGTLNTITTDNGVQFNSDFTKIFLDLYDVYIKFTVTYHPESNGLTKNRNRETGKLLLLLASKEKEWDLVLPFALWPLRASKNSVTKYLSFELLNGRRDQQPFELASSLPTSNVQGSKEELLKQFNTVKLVDPNTKLPLERPVHIKNIIKFNSTNYTIVVTKEGTNNIKRK